MIEIHTKTMLEVFDELERDFCVVGVPQNSENESFFHTVPGDSNLVMLWSAHAMTASKKSTHVKVASRPLLRTIGPPTMIVVWNPKSRSMFAHRLVSELLSFGKLLTKRGLSVIDQCR
jgi:hypothetical protein